ncbi:class F sortase [Candidatus Saccharibacteria bacterium]|nr:class F sortase [Candidatus Saccharibacteria bacterium]
MSGELHIGKKVFTKKQIFWSVLSLILIIFFAKVGIWEIAYYTSKEGSTRAVATTPAVEEEVSEEEVTEEQRAEYYVPADHPRYLNIESLGVAKSRIMSLGQNSDGSLATPNNIFDVAWYNGSAKPGSGGTIVINGHNGGPNIIGVFKYLPNVQKGEKITIERGDGTIFTYEVVENVTVPLSEANSYMKTAFSSPVEGRESLTLITCTGDWSAVQNTYLSRQFLRAVLI